MRTRNVAVLFLLAVIAGTGMQPPLAAEEKSGAEIKTVVPGRMVCSEKCKAMLDLANGVKKCPECDGICNVAHKCCTRCARRLGICEVCGKQMGPGEKPAVATEDDLRTLVAGNSAFACDLYARLSAAPPAEGPKGNLFFSPLSISTALGMTYVGARGETAAQMGKALHFSLPQAQLHPAFRQFDIRLNAGSPADAAKRPYELTVANALWGQQGYKFRREFVETAIDNYGGGLNQVDFKRDAEAARKTINQWVEDRTREKIKDLIPSGVLDAATRLVLTNAIYFKGRWASPFDEKRTAEMPFVPAMPRGFRGRVAAFQVPLMRQTARFGYFESDRMRALEMLYEGGDLAMLILLPKSPSLERSGAAHHTEDLVALEKSLTVENLADWSAKLKRQEVEVFLPRFKATLAFDLGDVLKSMGMADAFDAEKADFTGMTEKRELFISAVLHKAFVEVNEEGTEAAAATAVLMKGNGGGPDPVPVFRADHPFVFLIRHIKTGSIFFVGRVMDPR